MQFILFILPDGAFPHSAFEYFKLFLNFRIKCEKCCHLYINNMLSCNILHSSHVLSRFLCHTSVRFLPIELLFILACLGKHIECDVCKWKMNTKSCVHFHFNVFQILKSITVDFNFIFFGSSFVKSFFVWPHLRMSNCNFNITI